MLQQSEAASGVADRWHALTQARLEYLTNLFESGRWRRFYSEAEFLENVREATAALETWSGLLTSKAAWNKPVASPSRLDRLHQDPRRPLPNGWLKIVAKNEHSDK
jgi:uncharacterized repeat protein (TIGR03809 family)